MGCCWSPRFAVLPLIIGTAVAASTSVQDTPGAPPAVQSGPRDSDPAPIARVVRIDAVVLDTQGRPVLNLAPDDFELVEDGVVQKLHAVELRRPAARAAGSIALPPIESPRDEARAARDPSTRVFALLLDEFHVSAGANSERVRESVSQFVEQHIRPSDLVAVLRPLDSVTDIRFTRGPEAAREAIRAFRGRKGDYEARTEFEQKYIGRAPEAVRAARAQIVMSGLRALTSRLGELEPDRAAIILVSEGFSSARAHDRARRIPDVQGLVRSASRARVAVYAFNPEADSGQAGAGERASGRQFLRAIAEETGGEAVMNPAELEAGLARAARDLDGYYLLSYTSSHAATGRFYGVQVRARRSGAFVRTRTGYWAPIPPELLHGAEGRPGVPARVIRRSPLIETWLGLTVTPDGVQHATFTWEPAESRAQARNAGRSPSVVALRVTSREGAVLFDGEISAPRAGRAVGRQDAAFFEASPGLIQLDLAIFAADGTRIDSAAHDVDVPDSSRADPLILPPQLFRSNSAREFREISRDPAAAPVPTREFRRTERLLLRVPAYSPGGSAIALSARVLNRSGQMLRPIEPMPAPAGQDIRQFDLPLGWLAPGEYAIELNATSSAGAAKEIVRFRVTG